MPALTRATDLRTGTVKQNDSADSLQRQTQLCGRPSALAQLSPVGGPEDSGIHRGQKTSKGTNTPRGREGKEHRNTGVCASHTVMFHMVFYPFSLPPRSKGREGQALHTGEGDLNKHLSPDSAPQHSSSEDRWVYWANLFTVMRVTTKASAKHGLEQPSR